MTYLEDYSGRLVILLRADERRTTWYRFTSSDQGEQEEDDAGGLEVHR